MKRMGRIVLAVFAICYTFTCAMLFFGVNAKAYIDPSVMTYVIQAIAGVVIAIGAAVGIYWRKAKKKVQDKLGIDETREQESDDIVVKTDSETK